MIKMHTPNLTSSSIKSFTSLKLSQICRTTSNLLPASLQNTNPEVQMNPIQIITVSAEKIDKHKQILQWRQKTDFPIAKIRSYTFFDKKHNFGSSFCEILVQLESQMRKFNDLTKLPFFQAIYVLKESMVGFERLCHRFGFFNICPDMIMFNRNQNCKVWISKNWYSHEIEPSSIKSEKQFLLQLCEVVEEKSVRSKISCEFFERIRNCKYFFQAICCIQTFAKTNKIKMPTKLQNLDEIKSPLLKTSLTMDLKTIQRNKNLVVSAKIPRFIKKIEVKKVTSQQIYTPLPRKISMATQLCANDRSFTNVSRNHSANSFLKNDRSDNRVQERDDITFDEENFLKDMNIRLIEPNGEENKKVASSSPRLLEKYVMDTPETQFSPLGMVSEIDMNDDKKSGFSFNRTIKRQESSSFETAERMFLTVCKSTVGKGLFSPLNRTQIQYSPRFIRTLQYLDTEDIESLEDFCSLPRQNKFIPISINQIRQKRKLSGGFGNGSGRFNEEQNKKDEEKELYTPKQKTSNLLNIPKEGDNKISMMKSPSHLIICQNRKKKQDIELEQQEKEQEEREFLRQNIMNINGWKGLSILQENKEVERSFVDQKEIPMMTGTKTSELPKLGGMGRDVKTSMINDFEFQFQLEYGQKIEQARSVRNEIMGLLQ